VKKFSFSLTRSVQTKKRAISFTASQYFAVASSMAASVAWPDFAGVYWDENAPADRPKDRDTIISTNPVRMIGRSNAMFILASQGPERPTHLTLT